MYSPDVYKLPSIDTNIITKETNVVGSKFMARGQIYLGDNIYLKRAKDNMEIAIGNKFKKKKVYNVVNKFEPIIDNYNKDIFTISKTYLKTQNNLISTGFFKLWEMIINFDLIDIKNKNFMSSHLAEGPGAFIQATLEYRKHFSKDYKNDKYCTVTLNESKGVLAINKELLKCSNVFEHKTYKQPGSSTKKDIGDLTEMKTIKNYIASIKKHKKYCNLVTGDGGFRVNDFNTQEQELFKLIFGQLLCGVSVQDKGGHFVLKIYDAVTNLTLKIILIMMDLYEEVYIYKPFCSRDSNSEKFLIAKRFKYSPESKELKQRLSILEDVMEQINSVEKSNKYVVDIFSNYEVDDNLKAFISFANHNLLTKQYNTINNIIKFIKKNDFYGDEYHEYRDEQIKSNDFWLQQYYPLDKKTDYEEIIKNNSNMIKGQVEIHNKEFDLLRE